MKRCIRSTAAYGTETWTLQKTDQKFLQSPAIWWWRSIEISWTDCGKNEQILHTDDEQRNILHTIKQSKFNWIGQILRRNCLIQHTIQGTTEGARRRQRRCKQLLDDLKENRRHWNLKEEALDRTLCTTRYVWGYGPVARQTTHLIDGNLNTFGVRHLHIFPQTPK